jgi:hypothetical protein
MAKETEEEVKATPMVKRWEADIGCGNTCLCGTCKHAWPNSLACTAFPSGIPFEIRASLIEHLRPMPELGQKGTEVYTFAPKGSETFKMEE